MKVFFVPNKGHEQIFNSYTVLPKTLVRDAGKLLSMILCIMEADNIYLLVRDVMNQKQSVLVRSQKVV